MAKGIKAKLKEAQKAWKSTEANEGGFTKYDDGTYVMRLDKAFMDTDKDENLQIIFDLSFAEDPYKGKTMKKWGRLAEKSLEYTKGDLVKLDLELPDNISDLPELLETLEGIYVSMTLVTKDEYQNAYFNEVVDEDDLDLEDSDEDTEEDESEDEDSDEDENEDEDEDEEEGDEEDEDDEFDAFKMSKSELVEMCKEYGWKPNKAVKTVVAKLRKYVAKKYDELEEE